MKPEVLITESAWVAILDEINSWASQHKEGALYNLFGFQRAYRCFKPPWKMLELDDIDYFVVPYVWPLPHKFWDNGTTHVRLRLANDEEATEFSNQVDAWAENVDPYQRFEFGCIHSHPFGYGRTWPSSGGEETDFPRIFRMWEHLYKQRNLNVAIEIILSRSLDASKQWTACCFAFFVSDGKKKIMYLGEAEIVPDNDRRVQRILCIPYRSQPMGAEWEEWQMASISGLKEIHEYDFGWISYEIEYKAGQYLFIHLPPSFPATDRVLFQTFDSAKDSCGIMEVWYKFDDGFDFQLLDIVKHVQGEE